MRISIFCELENENIQLEYNKAILALIKSSLLNLDKEIFNKYYKEGQVIEKDFSFSTFIKSPKKLESNFLVNDKSLIINLSTFDLEMGVNLYNGFLKQKYREFPISKGNKLIIRNIVLQKEKTIIDNSVIFKTLSPIVVRDHNKETNKDWYFSFEDEEFGMILKRNLKSQLKDKFNRTIDKDIDELKFTSINMKKKIVYSYNIYVAASAGSFKLEGKQYLLDYFYKAGLGSKKGIGFGLLDIMQL